MSSTPSSNIVPELVSTAHSIINTVKNDPTTNAKATALLGKASGAIESVRQMGADAALTAASTKLKTLKLGSDHALSPHVDAAKSAIATAQKLMKLF